MQQKDEQPSPSLCAFSAHFFYITCLFAFVSAFIFAKYSRFKQRGMRKIYFETQLSYRGGSTMCSLVCVLICYYMLQTNKNIQDIEESEIQKIMQNAADLFRQVFKPIANFFHTIDVVNKIKLQKHCTSIKIKECAGLVHCTPTEMCNDTCMDMVQLLQNLQDDTNCTVTFNGHTIAFGKKNGSFWGFDSLKGEFFYDAVQSEFEQIINSYKHCNAQYSTVIFEMKH